MTYNFDRIKLIPSVWETPIIKQEDLFYLKMNQLANDLKTVHQLSLTTFSDREFKDLFSSSLSYYKDLYLLYNGNEQVVRFYDDKFNSCLKELVNVRPISWKEEESFLFFYDDNEKSVVQIDLIEFKIVGRLPQRIANVTKFQNRVFFTEINIIAPKLLSCYESGFTKKLWQLSLLEKMFDSIPPDERYFGRDFFCWEDVLIVRIGRAGYMGLHIETGELLWENYSMFGSQLSFGKLYAIGGERFGVVDAKTGRSELLIDLKDEFAYRNLFSIGSFTLDNDYIYFKDGRGKLGVFSIEERKIIWHHDLNTAEQKVEFGANEAPVVAGDKLMILDLNHVLHIFQRAN